MADIFTVDKKNEFRYTYFPYKTNIFGIAGFQFKLFLHKARI